MDSLKSHDRLLLGLDKNWDVANVALDVASKSVTISLEYRGSGGVCLECGAQCGLKDHGPERRWCHAVIVPALMKFLRVVESKAGLEMDMFVGCVPPSC
jgi:hypothetical protein